MCHESVPVGKDDDDNPKVAFGVLLVNLIFEPKAHWDIGQTLIF